MPSRGYYITIIARQTFNYQHLRLSGDISPNPGPKSTRICADCGRAVAQNHRATRCDVCSSWTHIKCGGVLPNEYHHMKSTGNFSRTCRSCLVLLQQLPFANSSLNSSSNSEPESMTEEQNITLRWTEFDNIVKKYQISSFATSMQTVSGDSSFMKSELGSSLVELIFLLFRRLRALTICQN